MGDTTPSNMINYILSQVKMEIFYTNNAMNLLLTTTTKEAIQHINMKYQVLYTKMLHKKNKQLIFINQSQLFG